SPRIQAGLLRVLEERRVQRLGSTLPIDVDVRIICATSRDLEAMVRSGALREDLYYRLRTLQIRLPPLRERVEDIPIPAPHLLDPMAAGRREPPRAIDVGAVALLASLPWPGNVRQLDNVLRAASLFAEGDRITCRDIEDQVGGAASGAGVRAGRSPWDRIE